MNVTSRVLASTMLATSLLPAQGTSDTAPVPLPRLLAPIHTAAPDRGIAYGIWAAGDNYKVSFHGGMTFVPYLGAGYPVTQSLHWQTTSAQLGTHELLANPTPVPVQGEFRYEYRFGMLTEAYDVRHEGLEQSFVLDRRPLPGDLVIRGVITSLLHPANAPRANQALVFADDRGNDLVQYGAATAFDARGDSVPVDTAYADGVVTLTVPGAWLEHAALPVTVDPLLARIALANWTGSAGTGQVQDQDIARSDLGFNHGILVAHTRSASASDSDLMVQLCNEDFSPPLHNWIYADITTGWSTDQVSCAFVGGSSRWVIVFRRLFTNLATPTSELRCHVRDSTNTSTLTNVGMLNPPPGHNDWRPDVGGVRAGAVGHDALVVFQREDNSATGGGFQNTSLSDVRGCLLDTTTANGTFGAAFPIHSNALYDNERPSVNQVAAGGANFSWVVVFQRFLDGAANEVWHLLGARVDNGGTVASGTWASDIDSASPAQHQLGPIVEGASGRYAVVFTTVSINVANSKLTATNGRKVQIERFDWTGSSNTPGGDHAPVELDTANDRRFETAGLGFDSNDRSHWTAGIREISPGTPAMHYVRVGFNGEITEGVGNLYLTAGDQPLHGACTFDIANDKFLFAFGVDNGTDQPLYGRAVVYQAPQPQAGIGVGCSSASMGWNGNQQIGAEFNSVEVSAAPPTAVHLMLLSLASTNVPILNPVVAPNCRLLVDTGPAFLGSFPTAVGANVTWELALPEFLAPQSLFFQDWYLDATGLLYSTYELEVPIVR